LLEGSREPLDLGGGLGGHLGVVNGNELARLRELVFGLPDAVRQIDDGDEALMFPAQRRQLPGVLGSRGVGKFAFDFGGAGDGVRETVAEAQADFPAYFWRKRSTRPAVSTSFCFPVKNGWQLEQISRWSSPIVERVCQVLPQAHFTVAVAYSGWMSAFTSASGNLERAE
jgi:hypothetical protein